MRKKQHKNAAHAHIGNRIIKVKDVCRIGVLGPPMVLFNSSLKRWSMFNTSTMNGVVQYFCGVPLFFCVLCTCCVDRRPLLYARVLALFCLSFLLIYTSLIFWFFAITILVCVCVCEPPPLLWAALNLFALCEIYRSTTKLNRQITQM